MAVRFDSLCFMVLFLSVSSIFEHDLLCSWCVLGCLCLPGRVFRVFGVLVFDSPSVSFLSGFDVLLVVLRCRSLLFLCFLCSSFLLGLSFYCSMSFLPRGFRSLAIILSSYCYWDTYIFYWDRQFDSRLCQLFYVVTFGVPASEMLERGASELYRG